MFSLFRRRPNDVVASYAACLAERDEQNASLLREIEHNLDTLAQAEYTLAWHKCRISALEAALAASHNEARELERRLAISEGRESSNKWAA